MPPVLSFLLTGGFCANNQVCNWVNWRERAISIEPHSGPVNDSDEMSKLS